ncbi:MAG: hypothetical protein FWF03_08440, partial [Defluviitaleaceae bacterium]|nr:hypothetical protein [Defluviitaleaceae bacterium]
MGLLKGIGAKKSNARQPDSAACDRQRPIADETGGLFEAVCGMNGAAAVLDCLGSFLYVTDIDYNLQYINKN